MTPVAACCVALVAHGICLSTDASHVVVASALREARTLQIPSDHAGQLGAIERLESRLCGRGDSLAWLARLVTPDRSAAEIAEGRAALAADLAEASKPIAGNDDDARSLARAQRLRGTPLWAMACAIDPSVSGDSIFRPWMEELVADPDALAPLHRGAFLLAVALIRQREGGDAAGPLALIIARTDFPAAERVAARAIQTTLGADRRAPMSEAMRTALRASVREAASLRLLTADIIARSLADPAEAWCALVDLSEGTEQVALAQLVVPRLRRLACDPASARPLHAIAALRASEGAARAALEARLRAIAGSTPVTPLVPLALQELAWSASDAKRYDEAIALYERFAREFRANPNAESMMGVAIFLRSALRERGDSEEARKDLATSLAYALETFPQAKDRVEWLVLASSLAAERHDVAGLCLAADAAPDSRDMVPLFLRAAAGVLEDETIATAERVRRATRYIERARSLEPEGEPLSPDGAECRALDAARMLLAGDATGASAAATALTLDASAPGDIRARALATLVAALDRRGGEVRLPEEVVQTIARDPAAWWPAVRPTLRAWVDAAVAGDESDAVRSESSRRLGVLGPLFLGPASRDGDLAWRCRLAEATIRAGAATEVERIFPAEESHTPDALLLRAEGQRRRGGSSALASAMRLFREVTDASAERSPMWWRAELGQLRVAAASPGNVDAVRARIHWLRSLDQNLGGAPTGPAIESLLRSLPDR